MSWRGAIAICVLLAGCAPAAPVWSKPDALRGDLPLQVHICERWSRDWDRPKTVNLEDFERCMTASGWGRL